ncbi:hypothetical protein EJ02DRAFT_120007 [Clathrospora elynae]|uniref:Uncharacterized protein n=1 Tax=Clathrospora elynae TaxID=706981 RepID=A0A6A5S753_9PLEO|nr:hypothetical protein EJ02DRAFT_120007 [Clathrospora elynae]
MAESESDSGISGVERLPKTVAINIKIKITRRQLTLIAITVLLNLLLWSSLICLATSIYQIVSDPKDMTNIAPVVLTSTSALATIAYAFIHTIFSLKQKIWERQQRHTSASKKTPYVAIHIVVSLCVLWLLTSGWNMITVARRPTCLDEAPGLQEWEFGLTCQINRVGIAFAAIALTVSCTQFCVLAVVNRPFEAHLFNYGYHQPADLQPTPPTSQRPSPARYDALERCPCGRRRSVSTHRSTTSNFTNTGVDTINLSTSPPPPTISAPSPVRSLGSDIFTSSVAPPPIPSAFIASKHKSSKETLPPMFYPSMSHKALTRPPRIPGLVATSGFAPLSIPAQYPASTWRAIHPSNPPCMSPASRSFPHLPSAGFPYHNRYSRSSISLTRPHRLSYASPADNEACSLRSWSTGPEGRASPLTGADETSRKATPNQILYAILNGTPIPGTTNSNDRAAGRPMRTASAPDVTVGAQPPPPPNRMAMGWKTQLTDPYTSQRQGTEAGDLPGATTAPTKIVKLVPSSSSGFLGSFSPDTSPDDDAKSPQRELEKELDARIVARKPLPGGRSRSVDPIRQSSAPTVAEAAAAMVNKMPSDLKMHKSRATSAEEDGKRRKLFKEVKNMPLPRINLL